jgi:hypothetical protein
MSLEWKIITLVLLGGCMWFVALCGVEWLIMYFEDEQ